MKRALKWIAWGLLALIAVNAWSSADKVTQWAAIILVCLGWISSEALRMLESHQKNVLYRLSVIEEKLQGLENHPLNTLRIAEGVEGLVDEYHARRRAADADPHRP